MRLFLWPAILTQWTIVILCKCYPDNDVQIRCLLFKFIYFSCQPSYFTIIRKSSTIYLSHVKIYCIYILIQIPPSIPSPHSIASMCTMIMHTTMLSDITADYLSHIIYRYAGMMYLQLYILPSSSNWIAWLV